jgi:hypothetical protein
MNWQTNRQVALPALLPAAGRTPPVGVAPNGEEWPGREVLPIALPFAEAG